MKNSMEFPQKTKNRVAYDPAIPFLGIYLNKTVIWKDTCTPVFIATLSAIASAWKQPKGPWTNEWIKKMWYIYTVEYYLAIKNAICSNLSQASEGRHEVPYYIAYI